MANDVSTKRSQSNPNRMGQPADAKAPAPPPILSPVGTADPVPPASETIASDGSTSPLLRSLTNPTSHTATTATGGAGDEPVDKTAVSREPPDPFDPARLRLSQDFAADLGVKKALLTLLVRKPSKEWWVRTHSDDSYRVETNVLELKEDREMYLVSPELWGELATESTFSPRALFTAVNRQGVPFIWPIRLPGPDGKLDEWNKSALEAAAMAMTGWVRVASNPSLGAYEVWKTTAPLPGPQWPSLPFKDLLRIAFKDKCIDRLDHPVLRKLRGET